MYKKRLLKSQTLLILTCLLVGCGKKIPECGEPNVQEVLNDLAKKGINNAIPMYNEIAVGMLSSMNNIAEVSDFFELDGITVKSDNQKFEAFSSIKKDVNSGINSCTALESGNLIAVVKFNVNGNYVQQLSNIDEILAETKDIMGNGFVPSFLAASKGKIQSVDIKQDGNTLIFSFSSTLPSSMKYESYYSDSMQQVVVNVIENK